MPDETRTVTGLLRDWRAGDAVAGNRLMDAVYTELHRMASSRMRRGRGEHTFQPTALVHELYLRLSDSTVDWRDRGHFYAVAAQQLRRVLTDYARRRGSEKRAGNLLRVPLADFDAQTVQLDERLLAVNEALDRLEHLDARSAKVVELRFFGGLSEVQTAEALVISVAAVKRDWDFARSWLATQLSWDGSE